MLYIKRNKDGAITGLTESKRGAAEPLDLSKPDVQKWLQQEGLTPAEATEQSLQATDLQMSRVLEDLIRALTRRGVIQLTDLPEEALSKLSFRTNLRQQRSSLENLMSNQEEDLPL